jgi:hypothetical protein
MSAPIRRQILGMLLSLTSHQDDTSRSAASGCLGAFCKWLPDDDMSTVIDETLLNISSSANDSDWQVNIWNFTFKKIFFKFLNSKNFTNSPNATLRARYAFSLKKKLNPKKKSKTKTSQFFFREIQKKSKKKSNFFL